MHTLMNMNHAHSSYSNIKGGIYQGICRVYHSNIFPWLLIAIGGAIRLNQYAHNLSLWLDESSLALNIVNRPLWDLLKPLDFMQVAPFGFLFIEKMVVQVLGNSEYSLRLFPLICGIASMVLFLYVAKRTIGKNAAIIALGLFSLSAYLIRYSVQVKQYSSDVFIALLIYAVTVYVLSLKTRPIHIMFMVFFGTVALLTSHPSVFVLGGIGCSLALMYIVNREWNKLLKLLMVFLFFLSIFVMLLLVTSVPVSGVIKKMQSAHAGHFMPFPFSSVWDTAWFTRKFFNIFEYPGGFAFRGVASIAFLVGCVSMYSKNRLWFSFLLSPLFLTLLASGLHMYPFTDRLLLFLLPSILIFIAEGADRIREKTADRMKVIGIIFIFLLFLHPVYYGMYGVIKGNIYRTVPVEDMKYVMSHLRKHYKSGDVLYLYHDSKASFMYYADSFGFADKEYIKGKDSGHNWEGYERELDELLGNKRVWILFSHVGNCKQIGVDKEKLFLHYLDSKGKQLDSFRALGASVHLYDLSD